MFEVEIEQLKKFLTAQLPQAQPYVFLRDILSVDTIAASYKRFFTAEVDWWLYEEQNQWLDNHRFDTSAPEFTPIFKQLEDALRQNAHFDYDVLLSTIDTAAKVHLNFLCRPRTTLKWFVYRGDPTKTIYEILLRLEYLTDYAYLTKGFYAWARKTYTDYPSMDLLSVVEFEKIIETIDNEHILDLSPHQFVDLLLPLFEFFNRTTTNQNNWTVPTESLIIFLDDKKVVLIAKELERLLYDENIEQISQDQFLEVVVNILSLVDSGDLQPDYQVIEFENESENEKVSDSIIETHESEIDATVQDHDEEIEYDEATENEELPDSNSAEITNQIPIDQSDVNADDADEAESVYDGDNDDSNLENIEDMFDVNHTNELLD
ncbi:MAG: hypothetical protein IPM69_09215 [Ignavibacteria bacterium]|nr:hypothetical protein [Ignavibacteria bacterium]